MKKKAIGPQKDIRQMESNLVLSLKQKGYRAVDSFNDAELSEGLTRVALNKARGIYSQVRLVPPEAVLNVGCDWYERPKHIVYATLPRNLRNGAYCTIGIIQTRDDIIDFQF